MVSALDSRARGWGFRSAIHETHGKGRLYSPATTTQQTLPQSPARPSCSLPVSRDQAKKRSNHGLTGYQTDKGQWNGSKRQEQETRQEMVL